MNKLGMVLGIAAVATLAGCKDPDYKRSETSASQNEVKVVDTTAESEIKPIEIEPVAAKCTCPPGTKHTEPCKCGAPDCKCIVVPKTVVVADVSRKPSDADYTIYTVQSGDYLSKISKRYNVTINSILRLNPTMKKDVLRIGQKIKLPGKLDIPAAPAVAAKTPAKTAAKKPVATTYTGATKEYVVKSGDTLGSIAYSNGINVRQLKSLNNLTGNVIKIGQKLKIPAEKVAKPVAKEVAVKKAASVVAASKADETNATAVVDEEVVKPVSETKEEAALAVTEVAEKPVAAESSKPEVATTTYVVQEGDDMTGVSIRWGVSAADIRELNNLADGEQLVPGQKIKLPADAQQ